MNKKLYIIQFAYDNGTSVENKVCLIRAESRTKAILVFYDKIYSIFSNNEDICTATSITEVSDGVDLIYTQGGSYWTKAEVKTI